MLSTNTVELLAGLSLFAGAVHVIAPDHWVPASILSWRWGWSAKRATWATIALLTLHVLGGAALYLILHAFLRGVGHAGSSQALFNITVLAVALLGLLRMARFPRVRAILQTAPENGSWSLLSALAVIGPAEALVPVLIRSRALGSGLLMPILLFGVGTLVVGLACVLAGRIAWDRPLLFTQWMAWAERRRAAFPIVTGLALVLAAVLLRP